jgi:hypothetical protein
MFKDSSSEQLNPSKWTSKILAVRVTPTSLAKKYNHMSSRSDWKS